MTLYTEIVEDHNDKFTDTFVCKNVAYNYGVVTKL